ncbi:MAG: four-carbon acid sugar kinase family protein [Vulcanimicrobiaceae bacterium]
MRFCILADDLTGANGTASLLKREGLPSQTHLFGHARRGSAPLSLQEDGAHVLDLDTRDLESGDVMNRLAVAVAWLGDTPDLIGLRIDSTLRGPIAASLDALLADERRLALVVPAFPASGRTTRNGIQYMNGVPLAETEVANDPHWHVTSSHLSEWLGSGLASAWAMLVLDDVRRGREAIGARLEECLAAGVRAVFCDAETDRDIEEIGRAALALARTHDVAILPADPGPFTATLVRLIKEPIRLSPLVFGIVGSIMETSRQQMDFVEAGGYAFTVRYEGQSAAEILAAFEHAPLAVKAMLLRSDTASLDAEGKLQLYSVLGDVFERVAERFPSLGGFLLSGGETAGRLLAGFGARSLRMQSEIAPLTSLSRIVDGRLSGAYLVTKGGTVGTTSAIADALGRLYDVLADAPLRTAARQKKEEPERELVPA